MPSIALRLVLAAGAACTAAAATGCTAADATPRRSAGAPAARAAGLAGDAAGILVLFRANTTAAKRIEAARRAGGMVLYAYRSIPALYVGGEDLDALAARMGSRDDVLAIERDRKIQVSPRPMNAVNANVRVNANASRSPATAVLSTGINLAVGLPLAPVCFTALAGSCDDATGYGTALARTAPPGATLYPVRVFDDDGAATWATLLAGIDWIAAEGPRLTPPIGLALLPVPLDPSPIAAAARAALSSAGVATR